MSVGSYRVSYDEALKHITAAEQRIDEGDSREESFEDVGNEILAYVMDNESRFDAYIVDHVRAEVEARWDAANS